MTDAQVVREALQWAEAARADAEAALDRILAELQQAQNAVRVRGELLEGAQDAADTLRAELAQVKAERDVAAAQRDQRGDYINSLPDRGTE